MDLNCALMTDFQYGNFLANKVLGVLEVNTRELLMGDTPTVIGNAFKNRHFTAPETKAWNSLGNTSWGVT